MSKADVLLKDYDEDLYISPKGMKVPVYKFIEKFLYIVDKEGKIIHFILNDEQIDLYIEICTQRRLKRPVRINILKARQIGFSTFIAALFFVLTIFVPNQHATIVADKEEHAKNLFKKHKLFYEMLPKELKLPKIASNARELTVDFGKGSSSSISVIVQGKEAGRSSTNQLLHLTECAFWENLNATLTSLVNTVSIKNLNSIIIIETTGNGFNEYKTKWDKDNSPNPNGNGYAAKFYPWWSNKEYQIDGVTIDPLYPWEKDLIDNLNLSMSQIAWYRAQYNEHQDLDSLRQEYPSTPTEAFINSGESVFNSNLTEKRKSELANKKNYIDGYFTYDVKYSLDGKKIQLSDISFNKAEGGEVKIFKQPEEGHPYIANLDPCQGGKDYYAIQVFDNYTGEQVATFHKNQTDDDRVAFTLVCLGHMYNEALISEEVNIGAHILNIAAKCGYKFIYRNKDIDDLNQSYQSIYGYKTKTTNRSPMIAMFREAFRDNYRMINDYDTLCEMEHFQIVRDKNDLSKPGKAQAVGGAHDDLVMAMCGVFYIRDEQSYIPKTKSVLKVNTDYDPFRQARIKKNEKKGNFFIKW